MTTTPTPVTTACGRCGQTRPCFRQQNGWGAPDLLCSPCWSRYADARANNTFIDANDAFDNANDDQLEAWFNRAKP